MLRTLSAIGLSLALGASGAVSGQSWGNQYAGHRDWGNGYRGDAQETFDYAEVVSVEPIVVHDNRPDYREHCWNEPVTYRESPRYRYDRRHDRAPAILGAIIGGAIGHQFGHGHGRDAATAAGALLGYQSVRDDQRRWGGYYTGGREYTRYVQRCAPRTEYRRDEQVAGFDVTYNYHGQIGRTTTTYHPGQRLRVRVSVVPE